MRGLQWVLTGSCTTIGSAGYVSRLLFIIFIINICVYIYIYFFFVGGGVRP